MKGDGIWGKALKSFRDMFRSVPVKDEICQRAQTVVHTDPVPNV